MIGIVMASPPSGVPLSPVSIAGLPALQRLGEACETAGRRFAARAGPEEADELEVALWDFGSLAVKPSWLRPTTRTIAWSLESPLVAHRAYHRITAIARSSDLVLGFPGVKALLPGLEDRFRTIYWPCHPHVEPSSLEWEARRFAVMVNSNKSVDSIRGQVALREPYRSARRAAAAALASTYRFRGQWHSPNLYRRRLEIIEAFTRVEDFDLWGTGWDRPIGGGSRKVRAAVRSCYRGIAEDKSELLGRFRFALCLENTRFPGYISEKLFDAFHAGTIPVYLGAPDVADYVPEDSYIDMDRFTDLVSLREYMRGMGESEAEGRLSSAREFLASPSFERFSEERFISTFMEAIDERTGEVSG